MTGYWPVAVGGLLVAAIVAGWPTRTGRARWFALTGPRRARRPRLPRSLDSLPPARLALLAAGVTAGLGGLAGGPVGAIAAGAYGGLIVYTTARSRAAGTAKRQRRQSLDGLCALAADLRAGQPASTGLIEPAGPGRPETVDRLATLARAAVDLAEQTGAPLAELIERIEADARAMDRAVAAAGAQAAGARATGYLLAGLPIGGIALGYGIGVDPLAVLLGTPIGAGCALGAIMLQLIGLAWTDRLSGMPGRTV